MKHSNHSNFYNSYRPIIIMHVLSHQPERVCAASGGDRSTEHSCFAAVQLPWRFWWKLAFTHLLLGGAAAAAGHRADGRGVGQEGGVSGGPGRPPHAHRRDLLTHGRRHDNGHLHGHPDRPVARETQRRIQYSERLSTNQERGYMLALREHTGRLFFCYDYCTPMSRISAIMEWR